MYYGSGSVDSPAVAHRHSGIAPTRRSQLQWHHCSHLKSKMSIEIRLCH